jgi:hypothetical protein
MARRRGNSEVAGSEGNTVHVIEPVSTRWKLFTMDGFANLVRVEEPNPGTGANLDPTGSCLQE